MHPTPDLLTLARRILAAPCCDDGNALARAVVAACEPPTPATGRVWRAGEACPIVAAEQHRSCRMFGPYKILRLLDPRTAVIRWYDDDEEDEIVLAAIVTDPIAEDWHEPVPLASTLPRVEATR